MKNYTIQISDEMDADIQYLIDTNDNTIRYPGINLSENTVEKNLQKMLDMQLSQISNFSQQIKRKQIMDIILENPELLTSVELKLQEKTDLLKSVSIDNSNELL